MPSDCRTASLAAQVKDSTCTGSIFLLVLITECGGYTPANEGQSQQEEEVRPWEG